VDTFWAGGMDDREEGRSWREVGAVGRDGRHICLCMRMTEVMGPRVSFGLKGDGN